jgi:PadR family transcriptional regulator AphA
MCPVEQSLLDRDVRNVVGRGLVAGMEARVGNGPPRKVYHLTPDGEAVFGRWLAEPVERLREVRLDFLLKLYFLHRIDAVRELQLLTSQIEVCAAYLDEASRRSASATGFARLVAGSKESAARATLEWLRHHRDELGDDSGAGAQAC